ncbi:MAG TPA: heavy-metal-associated domain-containing protein [Roseiflexaceae bacterium]|nr:heavy-metal-associated domain-containing protein [Roseiflexaceae bacterium]
MTTARVTLPLDNLGCGGGEAIAIERAIARLPGVSEVYINPLTEMAYVVYDPALMDSEHLRADLDRLGYGIPSAAPQQLKREEHSHMLTQSAQLSHRRPRWAIALAIMFVLVGVGLWIWDTNRRAYTNMAPATTAPAGATRTNEGGQVTIVAMWQGSGTQAVFNVAMNTHAVDLDSYDLKQLAVLRIDGGREIRPISWEAPKGGHHRSGTLSFPAAGADGGPLITPSIQTIELVIRDVAGVPERVFTWRP